MDDERDRGRPVAKGSTRTDLRVTRAPADTPRGKLHKLAAVGFRVGQELRKSMKVDHGNLSRTRVFAQRGMLLLGGDGSRGARLVRALCADLDRVLGALSMVLSVDLVALSDGLITSLAQLEAADDTILDLEKQLEAMARAVTFERDHNERLKRMLAAEQVRTAMAFQETPAERWEEPTRNRTVTADELRAITAPGDE